MAWFWKIAELNRDTKFTLDEEFPLRKIEKAYVSAGRLIVSSMIWNFSKQEANSRKEGAIRRLVGLIILKKQAVLFTDDSG